MMPGVQPFGPPAAFPRRILLAATGLAPQVVTETVYALAQREGAERFVPTEVHLVTTARGAEQARLSLLSGPAWFVQLRADYGLPDIAFDETRIHVLRDGAGVPLEDIADARHNEQAADRITELVRALTADDAAALHVSIAGGRKTMGFYLGYALTLFGRAQDRMSHVLVSAPYESSPGFFYPAPQSRVIAIGPNRLADAAQAQVTLADIPFVALRHGLPENLLRGQARYVEVVHAARRALQPPELVLDLAAGRIRAAAQVLDLARGELALLAVFARRAQRGEPALGAPPKGAADVQWAQRYRAELQRIGGGEGDLTQRALRAGMDGEYFSSHLSRLRKCLDRALGPAAAAYRIDDGGCRPRRYRLALQPQQVLFATLD